MSIDDLKTLLESKSWRTELEITGSTLRLFLQDLDSGECGVLAVEAVQLALPDEQALEYSWQAINPELGPPPEECLIVDLKTKIERDFPPDQLPF